MNPDVAAVLARHRTHAVVCGDSVDVLPAIPQNTFDAVVADPPAGIDFLDEDWDRSFESLDAWVAYHAARLEAARRVCKPSAHGLFWSLPRTMDATMGALRRARWTIHDVLFVANGQGRAASDGRLVAGVEGWIVATAAPGPCRLRVESVRRDGEREPKNLWFVHDSECCPDGCVPGCGVGAFDREAGVKTSGRMAKGTRRAPSEQYSGRFAGNVVARDTYADAGNASRFFPVIYGPKCRGKERRDADHATAKSIATMRKLVRLVAGPGELLLDSYAGSGATGLACLGEDVRCVLVEASQAKAANASRRLAAWPCE